MGGFVHRNKGGGRLAGIYESVTAERLVGSRLNRAANPETTTSGSQGIWRGAWRAVLAEEVVHETLIVLEDAGEPVVLSVVEQTRRAGEGADESTERDECPYLRFGHLAAAAPALHFRCLAS